MKSHKSHAKYSLGSGVSVSFILGSYLEGRLLEYGASCYNRYTLDERGYNLGVSPLTSIPKSTDRRSSQHTLLSRCADNPQLPPVLSDSGFTEALGMEPVFIRQHKHHSQP